MNTKLDVGDLKRKRLHYSCGTRNEYLTQYILCPIELHILPGLVADVIDNEIVKFLA